MSGGTLIATASTERVGTVNVDVGRPTIAGADSLTIDGIARALGAMVLFGSDLANVRTVTYATAPALNDGLIGGWAYDTGGKHVSQCG